MSTDMSKVTAKPSTSTKKSRPSRSTPSDIVPPNGREKSSDETQQEQSSASASKAMQDQIAALNDPKRGQGKSVTEAAAAAKPKPDPKRAAAKTQLDKHSEKAVKVLEKAPGPMHQRLVSHAVGIGKKKNVPGGFLIVETEADIKAREALYRHMSNNSLFINVGNGVFDLKARNPKGAKHEDTSQYWTSPAQLKAIQAAKEAEAAEKRAAEKAAREAKKEATAPAPSTEEKEAVAA